MNSQQINQASLLQLTTESSEIHGDLFLNIKIKTPQMPAVRSKTSIICVLDISGSMDTEATQSGKAESDGFTRLDLVKHSVNTIIASLSQNDTLGIVTFSNSARVDFQLAEMTEENKKKANQVIKSMKTQGATNLWDGILKGLETSKHEKCKQRNTFVLVLSDGEPNQHPPEGQLKATKKYLQENPTKASLSMFGYGFNLDTKLLSALTELGGGCFGYIPDCSMIGTIFVNFLSSVLSSFCANLQVTINLSNDQIKTVNGKQSGDRNTARLGMLQYGVTRNCSFSLKGISKEQEIKISFSTAENKRVNKQIKVQNKQVGEQQSLKVQVIRNDHINFLERVINNGKGDPEQGRKLFESHLERLRSLYQTIVGSQNKQYIKGLIRDISSENTQEGQIMIALSNTQYWNKWGYDYFNALKIAHSTQICTNFKDPGLQNYGGDSFKNFQNQIDTIFINLPPPIPSIQKYNADGQLLVVSNMNSYYDQQGGCIHGYCQVLLKDGEKKIVKDLKRGDIVIGRNGTQKIRCVIETKVQRQIQMVKFQKGLIITKYHPVFVNNQWSFPINKGTIVKTYVQSYYNFVLESGDSMIVNEIPCITLGHGILQKNAQHSYFGSDLVIKDLERLNGWEVGKVQLSNSAFKRNPETLQVIGMGF